MRTLSGSGAHAFWGLDNVNGRIELLLGSGAPLRIKWLATEASGPAASLAETILEGF